MAAVKFSSGAAEACAENLGTATGAASKKADENVSFFVCGSVLNVAHNGDMQLVELLLLDGRGGAIRAPPVAEEARRVSGSGQIFKWYGGSLRRKFGHRNRGGLQKS